MPSILDRILQPIRISARTPPFVRPQYGERGNYEDFGNYSYGGTQPDGSWEQWENEPSYHTGTPSPASPTPGPIEVAASQAPRKADYQRGLGRRILGGIIEAASPLAGGFGVNPHIVADLGRDVSAPGYNRAMDEYLLNEHLAKEVSAEQDRQWQRENQQEANRLHAQSLEIMEQNRQDALAERVRADRIREEGQLQQRRQHEIENLRAKKWRESPLEQQTVGNLQIPLIPAREPLTPESLPGETTGANLPPIPTTPLNRLPSTIQPVTGQLPAPVPKGYTYAEMPESQFSPNTIAGYYPDAETAAKLEAQAKIEMVPTPLHLLQHFKSLNLPATMSKTSIQSYQDAYEANLREREANARIAELRARTEATRGEREDRRNLAQANKLGARFDAYYRKYGQSLTTGYANVANAEEVLSNPRATGPQLSAALQTVVYQFADTLDKGRSTVREGEVDRARAQQSWLQRLNGISQQLKDVGGNMSLETARAMIDQTKTMLKAMDQDYAEGVDRFIQMARRQGVPWEDVVGMEQEDVEAIKARAGRGGTSQTRPSGAPIGTIKVYMDNPPERPGTRKVVTISRDQLPTYLQKGYKELR